ncbi:tol-pal system protein YbgF [Devosia sp. YIM 151766]|uniref:tol-pal system protein YbgF n=1 Tax=Devosia sp. YIM 151766 TaxID=3017325 RepID=UPI00255CA769|nr:tol-pal system protein YbgF [Devosia sp. YIM 151766]WIY52209.1 tol-pal system protein YbgF [Devosia sp. YIM 151766]
MTLGRISKWSGVALCALGLGLAANGVQAQTLPPQRMLVAQADSAQVMVRIQQMEEQIRLLNGQIEGLTFQLTQLQEILNRFQEDSEFRFEQLEGGAPGKTEAATPPGGATQPEALPQDPAPSTDETVSPTIIPEQGVRPLPGEQEFDPSFDDGSIGESSDPLVGTGQAGGIDLITGQPLNLSYDPRAEASGNPDADAQFRAGYEALINGDYDFAEQQFGQFLELYPDNPQAADAANWLGEALMARSAYAEAADVLVEAYQKNADHPRAPDLLLKLGMSLSGVGERETACRTFAEIERRYTDTIPAFQTRLAEEKTRAECPPA